MYHINRRSIKSIFLFLQIIVMLSTIIILVTNVFMINRYDKTLKVTADKNEALSNIFNYNDELNYTICEYLMGPDQEILEEYEMKKTLCMKEFDELMTNVSMRRTRVMFKGLRNMYETSFRYADQAIEYLKNGEGTEAYSAYRNLIKNSDLISDVFSPMYSLNTDDLNFYLADTVDETQSITKIILIIQTLMIVLILCVLYYEMTAIKKKIAVLYEYADCVSRQQYGNGPEECCQDSDNELDHLGLAMQKMAESIRNYVKIIEEKDRQALRQTKIENEYLKLYSSTRDTEIKALNSQMNPHFLYNTLGIVSQLCYMEGAEKASRMLDSVIDTFQYITRASNSITDLKSEIDFLKNYFYICGVRYQNKIRFMMDIHEDVPNIKLPGMILQPIVENAVLHGLENCVENGEIKVSIEYQDSIFIIIEDNGVGMNYENMEEVMFNELDGSGHIGVNNVLKRLRLYFGKKADVILSSEENCGTVVTIIIPVD